MKAGGRAGELRKAHPQQLKDDGDGDSGPEGGGRPFGHYPQTASQSRAGERM